MGELDQYDTIDHFFMEQPFTAANASTAKNDVIKLAMNAGMIAANMHAVYNLNSTMINVAEWKGQLTKEKSTMRIIREMKKHYPKYRPKSNKDHETDAIGIGMFCQGRF